MFPQPRARNSRDETDALIFPREPRRLAAWAVLYFKQVTKEGPRVECTDASVQRVAATAALFCGCNRTRRRVARNGNFVARLIVE